MITFGSLFAGIGGFDLGFERAGMACKWQVEIDDYANRVLAKHWPSVHRERDIRQCGSHNLQRVDVICGGFPCQDISYAGLGAGLDGERSGLFFEAVRVVRELQPRVIVLENVAALLTRGLDRVLGTLAEIGFDAEWHCIPAAAVGAPHIRDRVFVFALSRECLANANSNQCCISPRSCACTGRNGKTQEAKGRRRVSHKTGGKGSRKNVADITRKLFNRGRIRTTEAGRGEFADGNWWLTEPDVGRVADGIPARVDRLRGLGNAVVPQVAEWIGRRAIDMLQ